MGQGCSINSFISTHLNKTSISYPKPGPFTVPYSSERRHQVAQNLRNSVLILTSFLPLPRHPTSSCVLSVYLLIVPRIQLSPSPLPLLEHLLSSGQLQELLVSALPAHSPNWPGVNITPLLNSPCSLLPSESLASLP